MNSVQLVGRLVKDIEIRYTQSGTAVGTFTLAVNRNFKNDQGEYEADFIQCVIWRKPATILAQYTKKGSRIGVEGWIQTRNYENQHGQRVYVTEVNVDKFHFLDTLDNQSKGGQGANQGNQPYENYNAPSGGFGGNNANGASNNFGGNNADGGSGNSGDQGDLMEGVPF